MKTRSAAWAVFLVKELITKSRPAIHTSGDGGANISPITRKTARTSAWRRGRRRADRLSHARPNHANLGPCLASAVFIIATPGRQLRDRSPATFGSQPRSNECCYIEVSIAIHLGPIQPNSHSLKACTEGTDHLCGADLILMTDRGRSLRSGVSGVFAM